MPKKAWMSWSTGKDSAYALARLLDDPAFDVTGLFTTVTDAFNRVSMHAVRESLLEAQAERLNLPLHKVMIPFPCPNETYEQKMKKLVSKAKGDGVEAMAFGDLFLQDVRAYRIKTLDGTGIAPLFPIWNLDTHELAQDMIARGFRAIITCVDEKKLDGGFSGRRFDQGFLTDLPEGIDPCGENGEFHSFVYDCPLFAKPIAIAAGGQTSREGFTFTDILPADEG